MAHYIRQCFLDNSKASCFKFHAQAAAIFKVRFAGRPRCRYAAAQRSTYQRNAELSPRLSSTEGPQVEGQFTHPIQGFVNNYQTVINRRWLRTARR